VDYLRMTLMIITIMTIIIIIVISIIRNSSSNINNNSNIIIVINQIGIPEEPYRNPTRSMQYAYNIKQDTGLGNNDNARQDRPTTEDPYETDRNPQENHKSPIGILYESIWIRKESFGWAATSHGS